MVNHFLIASHKTTAPALKFNLIEQQHRFFIKWKSFGYFFTFWTGFISFIPHFNTFFAVSCLALIAFPGLKDQFIAN